MAPRQTRAAVPSRIGGLLAVPVLLVGIAGCSGSDDEPTARATPSATATETSAAPTSEAVAAPTGPIGPGCDLAFPAAADGTPADLSAQPVSAAVGANPQLSTLTAAVGAANLVDVLNTREEVTVLAPTNAAFDALGPDAVPALLGDVPRLTSLLTHHVLPGRLAPADLVGEHVTLNGDPITVAGPPEAPTVAAEGTLAGAAPATVVCGDVPTANATVYVIDQVLAPAG
ncbi:MULTISPECIES: fasciclin domain-containing protein [unclassified Modestobacter]|uniref:fasciclin domain-containing protein n=1 Tax=unclassified Modestobacter TaxID=2643866 RepID=UPI0022AAA1A4|nr:MULTISPECIES: fasciclin domain-containing protein [unclassified Modestobacter]MCZ2823401.1 fasciclin domain-containing protein [Modestobacter sp. VKM Ac-2981]MCZ2851646.1 fasciclin domain-containing protein [Modestobacter sp. VKM Ac-2982]